MNTVGAGADEEEERLEKKKAVWFVTLESEKYYPDLYIHILKEPEISFSYSSLLSKKRKKRKSRVFLQ